jgi:PAS domain-containing protein
MPTDEQGHSADHVGPEVPARRRGTIIARWAGTSQALIRLATGAVVTVVGAEQLEDAFEVGAAAIVFFDGRDRMLGWMLAEDPECSTLLEYSEAVALGRRWSEC